MVIRLKFRDKNNYFDGFGLKDITSLDFIKTWNIKYINLNFLPNLIYVVFCFLIKLVIVYCVAKSLNNKKLVIWDQFFKVKKNLLKISNCDFSKIVLIVREKYCIVFKIFLRRYIKKI